MNFPVQKTEAEWRDLLAAKGAEPRASHELATSNH